MYKKILCFLVAFMLVFAETGFFRDVFAENNDRILVVDTANRGVIREAGLTASSVHTLNKS